MPPDDNWQRPVLPSELPVAERAVRALLVLVASVGDMTRALEEEGGGPPQREPVALAIARESSAMARFVLRVSAPERPLAGKRLSGTKNMQALVGAAGAALRQICLAHGWDLNKLIDESEVSV